MRLFLVLLVVRLAAVRDCSAEDEGTNACLSTNVYDEQTGPNSCGSILTAGLYACDTEVSEATESEDAVFFRNLCMFACHLDVYDASFGIGECQGLLDNGMECSVLFANDGDYAGYCDFACGANMQH